ncbi:MAG: DegT/DnrJ/EryC1/StrS aminotransferase family protein [Myxococcales bacterium]|nr:MAG: DegT/DnrJ/EryC1/StrS aminotransferase family protein [Myxococcales bacterium]
MTSEAWREKYLIFGAPDLGREEYEEVVACLDSRWMGTGPRTARLERDFRDYIGAAATVALNSCTAALQLSLQVLGIPPGSEVITSTMTFCATANAIIHAGSVPVLVDCERDSMNIDIAAVERAITPRTRAIVPVHFAGRPCDMKALMALAKKHDLFVVEDCAHAIESTIDGQHCGTFGDVGCFSFYATKNMTTVEGGMVTCRSQELADRVAILGLHGMSKDARKRYSDDGFVHYDVAQPGYKCNMTDLAASLGIHQLARVEKNLQRRQQLWDYYLRELADLPLILPAPPAPGTRHALHLFTCLVDDSRTSVTRDQLLRKLHLLKIGCGVHYRAVHVLDYYRRTYPHAGPFPHADFISERTFSIPLSPAVTDEDAADVVRALRLSLA